ncbi:hypothetical protein K1Y78_39575 [Streptomyces sp. tea 10]|nr:hypothetical protein [Streptomyces sp. tea 10]
MGSCRRPYGPRCRTKGRSGQARARPEWWLSRFVEARRATSHRLLQPGLTANAMPQALGAQCLDREHQVVAFCGDGGSSVLLGDIMTLKAYRLPVTSSSSTTADRAW